MTRTPTLRALLAALLLAAGLALPLAVASATPAAAADPPTFVGHACPTGVGVTVVVDFTALLNEVHLGCAVGEQVNGMAALENAGFTPGHDGVGPNAIRTIDDRPSDPYPCGWLTCGFWGYYTPDASGWTFRQTGPNGTGTLPVGTIEGYAWAQDFGDALPRVLPADVPSHAPDCALAPTAPVLSIIASTETLPFALADGDPVEVAVLAPADPLSGATWTTTSSLSLASYSGLNRIVARRAGGACAAAPLFDATYDVRATYPGRAGVDANNPAVDKASASIVGFATGVASYTAGGNVNVGFQTPNNALGPIDSSLVVLGDRGQITLTFAKPITDGAGYDFAVYENGFASGANDFLELGYLEVSSNGTDFVRFDSASRRATPVGAGTQSPTELGGLGGRDIDGKGTPFDLTALKNAPAVRSGVVDLSRITHVRIKDIKGDGADLDSFGRGILDPDPTSGSAGFDLKGVAVLHQYEGGLGYVAVAPSRICDTRAAGGSIPANQCNGNGSGTGKLGPNSSRDVQVTGLGGVPASGVTAVVLNVAATGTTAASFLTVAPQGVARPNAANLNWAAGKTVSNLVQVPVSPTGQVTAWSNAGSVDVVVDVQGYVTERPPGAGVLTALTPARICDSRPVGPNVAVNQCDDGGAGSGKLGPASTKSVQITGRGGVPASGVSAVVLNVAVTNTTAASFLTAYPSDVSLPNAANVNWASGQTTSNRVIVPVGPDGRISVSNSVGSADVVIDVNGWYSDASNPAQSGGHYVALNPTRICDSRPTGTGISTNQCNASGAGAPLGPDQVKNVAITGGLVPAGAKAVVLNVAVTGTTANSFLTAYPHGTARPNTADLNWAPGQTTSNLVVIQLPADGTIDLWHYLGQTQVVVDVQGYYL